MQLLVQGTPPQYLPCRALRRHRYAPPTVDLDRTPGLRELALISACVQCETRRTDRWTVRVAKDGTTISIRDRVGRPTYEWPEDYRIGANEPYIESEDWQEAWLGNELGQVGLRIAA